MTGIPGLFSSDLDYHSKIEAILEDGKLPEYTTLEKVLACVPIVGIVIHIFRDPRSLVLFNVIKLDSITHKDTDSIIKMVDLESRFLKNTAPSHFIATSISLGMIFLVSYVIFTAAFILHACNVSRNLYRARLLANHIVEIRLTSTVSESLKKELRKLI